MKRGILIIIELFAFNLTYGSFDKLFYLQDTIIKTPTNVSVSAEKELNELSDPLILYWNSQFQDLIDTNNWQATIIGDCSIKYNCHGYGWHISDGGDTVIINTLTDVAKYYDSYYQAPSYFISNTNIEDQFKKVVYSPNEHSAVTTNTPEFYISKWGFGPLVYHYKYHTSIYDPEQDILTYYEIKINGEKTVKIDRVIFDTTLNINGATYSWSGNNFVCAGGSSNIGAIRGVSQTNQDGNVMVQISSPYSLTTVKGSRKGYKVEQAVDFPYVSGDRLVCSTGQDFSLYDLPPNNWVTWESSSNLYTSNNTTNPCTFISSSDGNGWIRARLNSPGCSRSLNNYNVWSGKPEVTVSGPSEGSVGNSYTYYEYPAMYSNPSTFDWTLTPPYDGNTIYNYGYWAEAAFYSEQEGYFQIGCTPQNSCGTGSMATTYINISNYDYSFSISPNPASNEIKISNGFNFVNKSSNPLNETINCVIKIYDLYGILHLSTTRIGTTFTIPINSLKDGNYIVNIILNDKTASSSMLIVKH